MPQSDSDSYILIIKDKPYEVTFKGEKGLINRTIDTDLEVRERWYTINGKKIPEINILWNVKGITPETASSLDTKEQIQILKDYLHGRNTINTIKNHQDNNVVQAKADYDIAVSNIFAEQPDYAVSCDASMRFACRILKIKLKDEDKTLEDDGTLTEMAGKLDNHDYRELEDIIPWIGEKCKEDESDASATLEDAVNAVRSSVALYAKLFSNKKEEKKSRAFLNIA